MRAAAIYARVSTREQADTGTSLQGQGEACRPFAQNNNYTVVCEVAEDASGTTLQRRGLDEIRDKAARGEFDALIIYAVDRLSRDDTNMLVVVKELRSRGITLECTTVR